MELLDVKEAAEFLGVSVSTLAAWRQNKKGPKYIKVGKKVKYSLESLESFINKNTVETKGGFDNEN